MKTYIAKIFGSKIEKNHFVSDIIEARNQCEAEELLINKKYFRDSDNKRLLGTCKKVELVEI